jgi:hypothetical protein
MWNVLKGLDEDFDNITALVLLTPFPFFLELLDMLLLQEMKPHHGGRSSTAVTLYGNMGCGLLHDKVGDVQGEGAAEPTHDGGFEAESFLIVRQRSRCEVVGEGVHGDGDVDHIAPLGLVRRFQVEGDGDEGLDTLDGGGLV